MLSIVIPVYNAEKYIKQCIESILIQKAEFEVLIVDDGSTDGSYAICRNYADRDSRIKLMRKNNTGVSDTRNTGITHAMGDYVLFVDADDYIVPDALEKISNSIRYSDFPDMLAWGYTSSNTQETKADLGLLGKHINGFSRHEFLECLISTDHKNRFRGFVWRCAFSRKMLHEKGICFPYGIKMAEDFYFIMSAALGSVNIAVLPEQLYVYRINEDSVTASYKQNVHEDMLWINNRINEDVCAVYPNLTEGLACCCAETYIVAIQNYCSSGTAFGLLGRIKQAWKIREECEYTSALFQAIKHWSIHTHKRLLVLVMLLLYLEPLYILLYSIKRRTLFL